MTEKIRLDEAVNEIEGFLLWEAEKDRARTRADAFCARLPWLTDTQRSEVELHYCQDQREPHAPTWSASPHAAPLCARNTRPCTGHCGGGLSPRA